MGEMRTYIIPTHGQRLKRYPFCLLERAEAVFDERRSTAGIEQERQKDTSGKRGAAFCFCKVVVNKMQQSAVREKKSYKTNNW